MMSLTFITFVLLAVSSTHAQHDQSCAADSAASARRGIALVQTPMSAIVQTRRERPQEIGGVALTTSMTQMEARVTQLEEVSNQGRTELKNELDTLTATVATLKAGGSGSLEDTAARVGAAEAAIGSLDTTAAGNHLAVRAEIEALNSRFDSLSKAVGDRYDPALLQTKTQQEPEGGDAAAAAAATAAPVAAAAAPAAPAAPAGSSLLARTTALEGRVDALEALSNQGRDDLETQLQALAEEVEAIKAGGVASLEHTLARQGSSESQLAALRDHSDAQHSDMKSKLDSADSKLISLGKKLGAELPSALIQTAADQPAPPTVPLTTRMANLIQRITSLEGKSGQGRVNIQNNLTALTATVGGMQGGGVDSLDHMIVRVSSTEADITASEGGVQQANADLLATVEALKTKTAALEQLVGSA